MKSGKILITGGAGFIGSHLTEYLLQRGFQVVVLDNLSMGNKLLFRDADKVELIEGDVRDLSTVVRASEGCSRIVHLAAIVGVDEVIKKAFDMVETETIGTFNVVTAAKKHKVKKLLYASSSAVYHKLYSDFSKETDQLGLVNTYAVAKRLNEKYLEALSTDFNISTNAMRFFNVYGGRQDERMVVPRFFKQAMTNTSIEIFGSGRQTRDFTYIDDVVQAMTILLFRNNLSGVFNISRGVETNIFELATAVKSITSSKSEIIRLQFPSNRTSFKVDRRIGSAQKLYRFTNYKPNTCLEEGIKQYHKYLLSKQQTAGLA